MARRNQIIISESDMALLRPLVDPAPGTGTVPGWRHDPRIRELAEELDRAKVVADHKLPDSVVGLGSEVHVRDNATNELMNYRIVLPEEASLDDGRVSILSPIGTALLGYRSGDKVTWTVPSGRRTWIIEDVKPREAAEA